MDNPIQNYWKLRLETLKEILEGNNFEVFIADKLVASVEKELKK